MEIYLPDRTHDVLFCRNYGDCAGQYGHHGWTAILIGSLIQGICMVLFPAIAQPFTRKILGTDDVAFGFWGSSLIVFTGWDWKALREKGSK